MRLSELERYVLGWDRGADLLSGLIPQIYFDYLRGGPPESAMYARRLCHEQVRGVWKLAWRIRVTRSTHLGEVIATRMPEDQAGVRVVRRHNLPAVIG